MWSLGPPYTSVVVGSYQTRSRPPGLVVLSIPHVIETHTTPSHTASAQNEAQVTRNVALCCPIWGECMAGGQYWSQRYFSWKNLGVLGPLAAAPRGVQAFSQAGEPLEDSRSKLSVEATPTVGASLTANMLVQDS